MRDFKKLLVWQRSHALTLKIYKITIQFPSQELYGLTSQMRRSSASLSTNLAEGCGCDSENELVRFFTIATGSSSELEYQLLLAKDLQYIDETTFNEINKEIIEIRMMLYSFIRKIRKQ